MMVGLVQAVPVILLALPAGQMADRYNRQRIVMVGQIMLAVASGGLAFVSSRQGPIMWMYACLFLSGLASAITGPAGAFCRVAARRLTPGASGLRTTGPHAGVALAHLRTYAA